MELFNQTGLYVFLTAIIPIVTVVVLTMVLLKTPKHVKLSDRKDNLKLVK